MVLQDKSEQGAFNMSKNMFEKALQKKKGLSLSFGNNGRRLMLIFSVKLVFKEELNLMLKVSRLLVKVWWVELGGTDSISKILRLANYMDLQKPKVSLSFILYLSFISLSLFGSLKINFSKF